jgi:hypothetical protein
MTETSPESAPADNQVDSPSCVAREPHTVHMEFGCNESGPHWTIEMHDCSTVTQPIVLMGLFINLSEIKTAWKDTGLNETDWADIEGLVESTNDHVYADQDEFVAQIDAVRARGGAAGCETSGTSAMDAFVKLYERQFQIPPLPI